MIKSLFVASRSIRSISSISVDLGYLWGFFRSAFFLIKSFFYSFKCERLRRYEIIKFW